MNKWMEWQTLPWNSAWFPVRDTTELQHTRWENLYDHGQDRRLEPNRNRKSTKQNECHKIVAIWVIGINNWWDSMHAPSNHMLYSTVDYLASNPDAKHWPNECISNRAKFGRESNICGHCWAAVSLKAYINPFPWVPVRCTHPSSDLCYPPVKCLLYL